jgi:hypothetical protein
MSKILGKSAKACWEKFFELTNKWTVDEELKLIEGVK